MRVLDLRAVAEAYDAMTNRYRGNPLGSAEAARETKRLAGVAYDPPDR
ncbi:MAG TPA: hypothetical protein PK830_00190 [Candidatus Atribacteria bacterium]|nr:hypothetical protein [Candidatus Atribacteria bacterium]HPT77515.1 hypothetical protein [Candidatus Atribacteria bacterium]